MLLIFATPEEARELLGLSTDVLDYYATQEATA